MPLYLYVLILVGVALLGVLAGLLTFKRSLRWCPNCGATLACLHCQQRPTAAPLGDITPTRF